MSEEEKTQPVEETPAMEKKLYFGSREVKAYGDSPETSLVWCGFADGTHESMHKDEWEAGKSDESATEDFDWARKRLMGCSKEVLEVLQKHNLRLEDLSIVFRVVVDSIQLAIDQSKEAAYGTPAWTVRLDDIQRKLDEGQTPEGYKTSVLRRVQGDVVRF